MLSTRSYSYVQSDTHYRDNTLVYGMRLHITAEAIDELDKQNQGFTKQSFLAWNMYKYDILMRNSR